MSASFVSGVDAFAKWRNDLLHGQSPRLYSLGSAFHSVELGPGLMVLVGAPPGAGKTALVMQWCLDALALQDDLRALVCNVEMSVSALLDRQLARLASIPLRAIRYRELPDPEALSAGLERLEQLAPRLAFLQEPFSLDNLANAVDAFGAELIVVDYVQRVQGPAGAESSSRQAVNALMSYLRRFVDAGVALLVVSAVGRSRDRNGSSSYAGDTLTLASFRESSELEYGCDSAYLLHPADEAGRAPLRCVKNRHGEPLDIPLRFVGEYQRFEALDEPTDEPAPSTTSRRSKGPSPAEMAAQLARLWQGAGAEGGIPHE